MPQLDPYLIFDGNCAEAMRFYEKTLGGKIAMMMKHGDAPAPEAAKMPPAQTDRILHARLDLDGRMLMASDAMAGQPYEGIKNSWVSLIYPDRQAASKAFDAMKDGGKVTMPFGDTFWADGFGMLTDRFGVSWMFNGPAKM